MGPEIIENRKSSYRSLSVNKASLTIIDSLLSESFVYYVNIYNKNAKNKCEVCGKCLPWYK